MMKVRGLIIDSRISDAIKQIVARITRPSSILRRPSSFKRMIILAVKKANAMPDKTQMIV